MHFANRRFSSAVGWDVAKGKGERTTLNTLPASEVETVSRCTTDLPQLLAKYVRQ